MSSSKKSREKKVLPHEETTYDLAEFIAEAERTYSPWPIEEEDVQLTPIEQKHGEHSELQRVATWTMVGVVGVVTIYGITTDNLKLLGMLATAAVVFLTRLVHRGVTKNGNRRSKRKSEQGESDNDADDG